MLANKTGQHSKRFALNSKPAKASSIRKPKRSGGHGSRTRNRLNRHLNSNQAASHSLTLLPQQAMMPVTISDVAQIVIAPSRRARVGRLPRARFGLVNRTGTLNEIQEIIVAIVLAKLTRELLHSINRMHTGQGPAEHRCCS